MKRFYLLASLMLAGCASTGGAVQTTTTIVADVQKIAVAVCSFEPTVNTILSIVSLGNPLVATAEGIANAICAAVTPKAMLSKRATPPNVYGVPVHGRFVR